MKLLLFITAITGMLLVGCGEDAAVVTGTDLPDATDSNRFINVGGGSTVVVETSDEVKANFNKYVENVKSRDLYSDMLEVQSKNTTITMGDSSINNLDGLSAIEFDTRLDYDFYIDINEVTQEEYYAVMGDSTKLPPSYGLNAIWKSMSQPVGNVTLYNALMFCNNKSELKGLEAVYTISGDKDAFTVEIDYSKTGFALPTSTEWEYVAKTIVVPDDSEDYLNSKYLVSGSKKEPLSKKELESLNGLNGYFGNIKEMCLSNLNIYNSDSLLNSAVTSFNSTDGEKYVAMGGSYKTGLSKIELSYRQGVSIYNQVEDIGLRCVIRKPDVADETPLVYIPIFDTNLVIDSNLVFDSTFVYDTTMTIETTTVIDTVDVGPPVVLDTLIQIDSIFKIDTLVTVDTTIVVDSTDKVTQIH